MEIEVKLFATLQEYLPKGGGRYSCKLTVENGASVSEVLGRLKVPEKMPKIILINGKYAHIDSILQPSDVLSVFPPLGGG